MSKSTNSIDYPINHPSVNGIIARFKNDGRNSKFKLYKIERNYTRISQRLG